MSAGVDRVAVVTGASAGIGLATASELAGRFRVVLVCRDRDRGDAARRAILERVPRASLALHVADLSSLAATRVVADELASAYGSIDLLVNNAGAVFARRGLSEDGFERHFATNFLGHFALTLRLLAPLVRGDGARVVQLGSALHRIGRMPQGRLDFPLAYHLVPAYARSKLAILLATRALAERAARSPIGFCCFDPGLTRTQIESGAGPFQQWVGRWFHPWSRPAAEAGRDLVHVAVDTPFERVRGGYFVGRRRVRPARRAWQRDASEAFWRRAWGWLDAHERESATTWLGRPSSDAQDGRLDVDTTGDWAETMEGCGPRWSGSVR
ncbi:MAG: SDR family NAD(P)-dependent oxidoreductase [Proteobacteria bacterium]|nr:SDR family NAD(P)-dependent oxidoreductase [Pseudomonadota bacterium]